MLAEQPAMQAVSIRPLALEPLLAVIGTRRTARFLAALAHARATLRGRTIWHINSTARGGGVAEMLQTMLAYERGAGLDVRWLVVDGDAPFFALTKRLHNRLHGETGDDGPLGAAERRHYDRITQRNQAALLAGVKPGDVVVLHDPQTAGLAPRLREAGAMVLWRCHIGVDRMNSIAEEAWQFLQPYIESADTRIFSRAAYIPPSMASLPVSVIPPAIDALSPKNQRLNATTVRVILRHIGLLAGAVNGQRYRLPEPFFTVNGVAGSAHILQIQPLPLMSTPLIAQVSRWDPLKDMVGVMHGFAGRLQQLGSAHLALVGPDPGGVTDDPEGARVYEECVASWHALPHDARERVHLVCLPMTNIEENALMVNAIQRFATIVVQKSLREGFGLTVTEALWKGRPVVASRVGGIQDQITDGVHGLLLDDPTDTDAFGDTVARLLGDPVLARHLANNARRRAIAEFLSPRQTMQMFDLIHGLDGSNGPAPWKDVHDTTPAIELRRMKR
jgi:trehalose synthase